MNIKKSLLALTAVSLTSVAMTSSVQARAFGDIFTECGIGAMVFPKHAIIAAISNVTWDLGTTAVSSNVSSANSCNGSKVAAAAFIHESYATLEQDIAKGNGTHLSALMDITGCSTTQRNTAIDSLRADFSSVVSAKGYTESTQYKKSETLYDIIKSEKFASACST